MRPALIDSSNGTGATLGLDFDGKGTLYKHAIGSGSSTDFSRPTGNFELNYNASGTVTADKDRNPQDFLNAMLSALYSLGTVNLGSFRLGGFGKFETDQSFDNKQFVYGARAAYGEIGVFTPSLNPSDELALAINRGQVDPKGDTERETALGTHDLPKYYRTDLELYYQWNVRWKITESLNADGVELDYRYFRESSPPPAVSAAGLDWHHFALARVNFNSNFFVAYGYGKLPFDQQNNKVYQVGLSYKVP